tara:strand:- start:631 stop:2382 length:1752 start_codon:yes stop_codon:yes gene_type:complete
MRKIKNKRETKKKSNVKRRTTYKHKSTRRGRNKKSRNKKSRNKKKIKQSGGGQQVNLSDIKIQWEKERLLELKQKFTAEFTFNDFEVWYRNNSLRKYHVKRLQRDTHRAIDLTNVDSLECLKLAMDTMAEKKYSEFINNHLEFIVDRALEFETMTGLHSKVSKFLDGKVELTQMECLCIISNAFLSVWNDSKRRGRYPACNYCSMFQGAGYLSSEWMPDLGRDFKVQKCCALMEYFMKRKIMYGSEESVLNSTIVIFELSKVTDAQENLTDLESMTTKLLDMNMMPVIPRGGQLKWENGEKAKYTEREGPPGQDIPKNPRIIDDPNMKYCSLNVDFANMSIGGGALSFGHVQEEEMFALHTDYCCAGLFCEVMRPEEAILLSGGEQIAENDTVNNKELWKIEPFEDKSQLVELDGGRRMFPMYTTAIDAYDFRRNQPVDRDAQLKLIYRPETFKRDLIKCMAGFRGSEDVRYIRTGNFGGGAFFPHYICGLVGDRSDYIVFKGLIQLLAASFARGESHIQLDYCPFDQEEVSSKLFSLFDLLKEVNVKELYNILKGKCTVENCLKADYIETELNYLAGRCWII